MDVFLGLLTLAFVVYFVFWEDFLRPLLGLDQPKPVKSLPPLPAYKSRSRVRNAANAANAGSAHQGAKSYAQNVPANVPGSGQNVAAPGAPGDAPGALLITENELQQLAGALAARATGATLDEAILRGFGLKKGGGPSYKRAKELFDTATKAP